MSKSGTPDDAPTILNSYSSTLPNNSSLINKSKKQSNQLNQSNKISNIKTNYNQSISSDIPNKIIKIPILAINLYLLIFSNVTPIIFFISIQNMLKNIGYRSDKNVRMIPGTLKTYNEYKNEINNYYFKKLKKIRPLFKKIDEIYNTKEENRLFHKKSFSSKDEVITNKKIEENLSNLIQNKNKAKIENKKLNKQGNTVKIEDIFLLASIFINLSNDNNNYNDEDMKIMLNKFKINDKNEIMENIESYFDLFRDILKLELNNTKNKQKYSLKDVDLRSRNPILDYFQEKSDNLINLNKHVKDLKLINNYEFEYHNILDLEIEEIYKKNEKITEYQLKKNKTKIELELDLYCLEYLCLKPLEAELNYISQNNNNNNNNNNSNNNNNNNSISSNEKEKKENLIIKLDVIKLNNLNNKSSYLKLFGKTLFDTVSQKKEQNNKYKNLQNKLSNKKKQNVIELKNLINTNLKYISEKTKQIKSINKKDIFKDLTKYKLIYDIDL